jgi:GntR family transcriptional repressor for pyruvate dehydrogenase complex
MVMSKQPTERGLLPDSRLSRAEAMARELEEEISGGTLSSGELIGTKESLRQRFGVAVATVNEAVKLLDSRGLTEARPGPGGGVFVAGPGSRMRGGPLIMGFQWTKATMADYHEVREALEPLICRQAARFRTNSDIQALERVIGQMESHLDEPIAYVRYNTVFHRRMAKLSRNAPLRSLYVTLLDFFENAIEREDVPLMVDPQNVEVHRELLAAISEGEGPRLEAAMRGHDVHRRSMGMLRPSGARDGRVAPPEK